MKNIKRFLCLITVISLVLSLVGTLSSCNLSSKEETLGGMPEIKERYAANSASQMSNKRFDARYSFYDDDCEYYIFYLGYVSHVPLQSDVAVYEFNGSKYEKELSTTETNRTQVTEMLSTMETKSVSLEVNASSELSSSLKIEGVGSESVLEYGFKLSQTRSVTSSQSIEKTVEYSKQTSETTKFAFDESWEKGFYRYILLGDVDVFGVLVRDIKSGECYTYTYDVIASQYYSLDYSKSALFDERSETQLTFSLSEDEIESLEKPSRYICTKVEYVSESKQKKIDASHEYTYDEFSISALSPFLNSDHTLCFKVVIEMKEENAGYQEIYLCKDDETHITGIYDYEFGGSGNASTNYKEVEFNWTAKGDQCTEIMKLRYGAHGDHSDDWYRRQAKVTVTVQK